MTQYDETFDLPVAFKKINLEQTLGEVISARGGLQLRAAETEKYPHVTFFFSGGREEPFDGEERILIPSPKVATYDMQPEMSAPEVAEKVAGALAEEKYNFVCLNFANPDMVGHTGDFEAAVKAVEAVDSGTRKVVESALAHGYSVNIIADHGNSDKLKNPDGSPHTAHTTSLVPHLIIKEGFDGPIRDGKLGDIRKIVVEYPQGWLATKLEDEGDKQASWRTDPDKAGVSSAIGDIGSHAEHLARYITGLEIESLCADITTFVPGRQLDDDANVLLRFSGGARGILTVSQIEIGEESAWRLRSSSASSTRSTLFSTVTMGASLRS